MVVLALDTTTRQGSAALVRDGVLVGVFRGDATVTHGERLPGDLIGLLDAHALAIADVDLFAVAAGPGSFTGLRIGIATQQGLALANDRPLVGVSALDALNHAVLASLTLLPSSLSSDARDVVAWIDAQRGQVFSARYRGNTIAEAPIVEKPAVVLRGLADGEAPLFAGDGAIAYQQLIRHTLPHAEVMQELPALAPSVAALAEEYLRQHGPIPPDAIRPIYVRRSDAELARDRKARLKPDTSAV